MYRQDIYYSDFEEYDKHGLVVRRGSLKHERVRPKVINVHKIFNFCWDHADYENSYIFIMSEDTFITFCNDKDIIIDRDIPKELFACLGLNIYIAPLMHGEVLAFPRHDYESYLMSSIE